MRFDFTRFSRLLPLQLRKLGFDFLGYHFSPDGLAVAGPTVDKFIARALLLYEHGPGEALASARLDAYVRRWVRWLGGGLVTP